MLPAPRDGIPKRSKLNVGTGRRDRDIFLQGYLTRDVMLETVMMKYVGVERS